MELDLYRRYVYCAAETHYSNYEIIHTTLNLFDDSTIFCSSWNRTFYTLLRNIAQFVSVPMIISHPSDNDLDSFLKPCDTMIFFTDKQDAESNEMMYNIIDDENSGFDQIIVCSDDGAGVYANNTG